MNTLDLVHWAYQYRGNIVLMFLALFMVADAYRGWSKEQRKFRGWP